MSFLVLGWRKKAGTSLGKKERASYEMVRYYGRMKEVFSQTPERSDVTERLSTEERGRMQTRLLSRPLSSEISEAG